MVVRWTDFQPRGFWSARFRVLNYLLEVELETVFRSIPESDFTLDVDHCFPPNFTYNVEQIEISVADNYIGDRIWMGSRIPGHWKRSVSMVVPLHPDKVVPCA